LISRFLMRKQESKSPVTGIAWVSRRDLGAGIAKLLTLDNYSNKTVLLSGDIACTVSEAASLVGRAVNKRIFVEFVSHDEYVTMLGEENSV
jgi:uncharacterized protein YbjT (DUF2867 family)